MEAIEIHKQSRGKQYGVGKFFSECQQRQVGELLTDNLNELIVIDRTKIVPVLNKKNASDVLKACITIR